MFARILSPIRAAVKEYFTAEFECWGTWGLLIWSFECRFRTWEASVSWAQVGARCFSCTLGVTLKLFRGLTLDLSHKNTCKLGATCLLPQADQQVGGWSFCLRLTSSRAWTCDHVVRIFFDCWRWQLAVYEYNARGKIPYVPVLQAPYYQWIGKRRDFTSKRQSCCILSCGSRFLYKNQCFSD